MPSSTKLKQFYMFTLRNLNKKNILYTQPKNIDNLVVSTSKKNIFSRLNYIY